MLWTSIAQWSAVATLATAATLGVVARADSPGPAQDPTGRAEATAGPAPARASTPTAPPPGLGDAETSAAVDRALRDAAEAAEANPDPVGRVVDLIRIGQAYARRGDRPAARATFARARALIEAADPRARGAYFSPLVDLAAALASNGDRSDAHESFEYAEAVLEASPVDGPELSWFRLLRAQVGVEGRPATRPNVERVRRFLLDHKVEAGIDSPDDERLMQLQAIAGDFAGAIARINNSPRFQGDDWDHREARAGALVEVARLVRREDGAAGDLPIEAARDAALGLVGRQLKARHLAAVVKVLGKLDRFEAARPLVGQLDALMADRFVFATEHFGYGDAMGSLCLREYLRSDLEGARRSALGAAAVLKLHPIDPVGPMQLMNLALALALLGEEATLLDLADRLADDDQRWDCFGWLPSFLRLAGHDADAARLDARTMALIAPHVAAPAAAGRRDATPPGPGDANAWFRLLAVQHASRGDVGGATRAIEAIPIQDRLTTPGLVVQYLAHTGHMAEALELARRAGDEPTRRRLLIEAATAFPGSDPLADLLARDASN